MKPFYCTPSHRCFAPARGFPDAEQARRFARQAADRFHVVYVVLGPPEGLLSNPDPVPARSAPGVK